MLDAQRLAVLAEVAHAGSIASAARRLAFTPSAVSQQIGKLERDLGCRLLYRHPRGVTLTPIGQALLSHAETVTGELRTAEQPVRGQRAGAGARAPLNPMRWSGYCRPNASWAPSHPAWRPARSPAPASPWFPRRWPSSAAITLASTSPSWTSNPRTDTGWSAPATSTCLSPTATPACRCPTPAG